MTSLTLGDFSLDCPAVMGILNVTPDSFSDGGRFVDPSIAVRHAEDMAGVVGREREAAGRADTLVQRDDLIPYLKSVESTVGSVLWVVQ